MDFQATALPDTPFFHDAFSAGWERYLAEFDYDVRAAKAAYLQGPVAMARLIAEHGGECREVAVAACLAGPAVFSDTPETKLDARLSCFSEEIRRADKFPSHKLGRIIPRLSADARLFFQATAIMLLEHVSRMDGTDEKSYTEAVDLYSLARGIRDAYHLDTRFEIAVMKATTVLEKKMHLWALRPENEKFFVQV